MLGRTVSHYRIVEELGGGGMGVVYKAEDTKLGRLVALKFLGEELSRDAEAIRRFQREARAASSLNHPNICTIYEFDEHEGRQFIVMELMEGRTLKQRIDGKPLATEEIVALAVQITEGLEAAHERGIIHRDIKPANLFVGGRGQLKVLDFGVAKLLPREEDATVTGTQTMGGAALGTLAYMAPEQLNREKVDARTDLYALGCVLYEMATGQRPFQKESGAQMIASILSRTPEAPSRLNPKVPAWLEGIILKCLEKEPGNRYQRASEVREAFEAAGSGAPIAPSPRQRAVVPRKRRASRKRIRALAVLPLANLSRDPEQEYFADGMTEALISDLAKLRALKVISRTSVMRYKGSDKSLPEIAQELNVDAVVEGSVLQAGGRVRITTQLIHAGTDTHLWAESYERDLRDVLVLQSEVARAIAGEIQVAVTPEERRRLASARPINPEAHEACLRGRFHWYKVTRENIDTAMGYFQLALEKDPNCALAYVGIAYGWLSRGETGVPPREAFPKAKAAALKALELDDTLAEVHEVLASLTLTYEWDWAGAEREFQRAIALNPNFADARFFYGDFLISMGRSKEGLAEIERALALDPFNFLFQCFFGWHLMYLRRDDEAILQLRKTLSREPGNPAAHLGLWGAFWHKHMYEEALAEAQRYHALLGYNEVAEALSPAYVHSDYRGAMRVAAETLVAYSKQAHVPRIRIARLFAHAEQKDHALDWLERAYEEHEGPLNRLNVVWDWDSLRDDPRFQALLRRMNFPE